MKSEEEKKKDNSTNQEHHGSGDNIARDKIVHIHGEKKYPKHLSSNIPTFNPERFVGREETLDKLHTLLEEGKNILLLNGLGGIGKTSVARMYCHLHEADYNHFVWFSLTDGFENALTLATGLHQTLGITSTDKPEQIIANIFQTLNTIPGNNLLIIDNADETLKPYTEQLPPTWKVLVTSREKMDDRFTEYALDVLDFAEAKLLFAQYFKGSFTDKELTALCEEIGYHTLTLELLAKTLEESLELQTITELTQYLQDHRLDATALQEEVFTQHSKAEIEIYTHLLQAFTLAGLEEEEKWLLLQFAVLPPIAHEGKEFLKWIQKEDTRTYGKLLKRLNKKGWLERKDNSFRMHRLIQSLIRYQVKASYENCEGIINTFAFFLYVDDDKDNPIEKFRWLDYGTSLCNHIKDINEPISILNNYVGKLLKYLGKFTDSINCYKYALEITDYLNLHKNNNIHKNDLALIYDDMGKYQEAAKLLEEALISDKQLFGNEKNNSVSVRQTNLGKIYRKMGRYDEAKELLEESLNFALENYGVDDPRFAVRITNLGNLHLFMKNYKKAVKLLKIGYKFDLKNFDESHHIISDQKVNLANGYMSIREIDKAEQLLKSSLSYDIQNFGKDNPTFVSTLNSLANIYFAKKEYQKAKKNWQEAYRILKLNFKHHTYMEGIEENLEEVEKLINLK